MLAGVLLHVIEAAGSTDATHYRASGEFAVNEVHDVVAFLADVEDDGFVEEAEVVGLATGGGIESGLIEQHFPSGVRAGGALNGPRGRATEDAGFEILKVGIVVVQAVGAHSKNVSTRIYMNWSPGTILVIAFSPFTPVTDRGRFRDLTFVLHFLWGESAPDVFTVCSAQAGSHSRSLFSAISHGLSGC